MGITVNWSSKYNQTKKISWVQIRFKTGKMSMTIETDETSKTGEKG
jgi:hypothetical protein